MIKNGQKCDNTCCRYITIYYTQLFYKGHGSLFDFLSALQERCFVGLAETRLPTRNGNFRRLDLFSFPPMEMDELRLTLLEERKLGEHARIFAFEPLDP